MSDTVFNAYSRYYDLLYRDKDYVAEAEYIADLLEQFGVSGKRLLEFGSGSAPSETTCGICFVMKRI